KCGPTETRVGAQTEYTVKVTNLTDDVVLENVVVIDKSSSQFRIDNADTGAMPNRTSSAQPLSSPRTQARTVAQESGSSMSHDANRKPADTGASAEKRSDRQERRAEERADRMNRPEMGAAEARFMVGRLNPRESRTITVRGVATATGQIFNCASATYDMY